MDSDSDKRTNALQLIESTDTVLSTQVINEVCCNLLRKANYSESEIQQTIRNFQAFDALDIHGTNFLKVSTML